MNSRQRFLETMQYGKPDRVPYFQEGIRSDVVRAWRKQGMPKRRVSELFPCDEFIEISPNLYPLPALRSYPTHGDELEGFSKHLRPDQPSRMPRTWKTLKQKIERENASRMLCVHEGFFLTMGVNSWRRFEQVMYQLKDDPSLVKSMMRIQGEFAAQLVERVLAEVQIDAAIFSEPIGGNNGPILSPQTYEEFVLDSYAPIFSVLQRHGVQFLILRTYANARALIARIIKYGFNCLWACEVNADVMNYLDIRREFGKDLRLIGGIDLDTLRQSPQAIQEEVERIVPTLLQDGGYVPLADGRVRADVPYTNYAFYRELLGRYIHFGD